MKIFKNNFKVIIGFIIGIILASSIAVYAYSYMASDIGYTKPETNTPISVETALNELYSELQDNSLTNIENVELISKGLDGNVTVPAGFRYVIMTNVYFGGNSGKKEEYINAARLSSYTNSTIIKQESSGYEYNNGSDGVWLIIAKINDTTLDSNFSFSSWPNIVLGIK